MPTKRQGRRQIKRSNHSICWLLGFFLSGLVFSGLGRGQAVAVLNSFAAAQGAFPTALIQGADGNFYGTTATGAASGGGSVFTMSPQGTVTILHAFGDGTVVHDGAMPTAGLIQASDGNFYGTTSDGGATAKGTVFTITPHGALTILHSFGDGSVANDGAVPHSSLIQGSDGNLYGTTSQGGSAGKGTIFEITLGGAVTILHSFGDGTIANDGATPMVGLVEDAAGNFYGTTLGGGAGNQGAVFLLNARKQLSILYSFSSSASYSFSSGNVAMASGSGGSQPNSRLIIGSDGNLYGTTAASGYGYGAIYKITPQGQETVLHYFGDGTVANDGRETNPPVESAESVLIQDSAGNFYGTTSAGGLMGVGALFEMTSAGKVTILHSFGSSASDGSTPLAGVLLGSDGYIYGTTGGGSLNQFGTIFKVLPTLPAITSDLRIQGGVGQELSFQVVATQSPTGYAASGLPAGLSLDASTGVISGTPVSAGISSATLIVTNAAGSTSVTLVFTILEPPAITSVLSEFGSIAGPFAYQITATGVPSGFAATGLPAGLSLDSSTGIISGTPAVTGTFPIILTATNIAGSDSQTLTLVITSTAPTFSQEYVLVHSFQDGSVNNEGSYPGALIAGPSSSFYGVSSQGLGTFFHLSAQGKGSVLSALGGNNGSAPQGVVEGSDGNFYGTTQYNGSAGKGTLFRATPAGVVTLLHTFGDNTVVNDGASPQAGLILGADGNFYGTTQYGGSVNLGTIFEMTPQGVVTILHSFGDGSVANDGAQPVAALVEDNGVFYGTTLNGGSANDGTVFSYVPGGAVTTLHSFGDGSVANDGQLPHAALVFDATSPTTLYGTTVDGGSLGKGTIFTITTSGVLTILHHFGDGSVANDGTYPIAPLVIFNSPQTGLEFFGTTPTGGTSGQGTVFSMNSSDAVTIVHNFGDGSVVNDGQLPMSGLCLDAYGNLYGTTIGGGAGSGTMYALVANLNPPAVGASAGDWTLTGTLPTGMTFDETTGAILGTPASDAPAGVYEASITSPQVVTTTQAITLTQTFAQWATSQTFASLGDGVPPMLKYLYDINPSIPMTADDRAALPTLGIDTTSVPGTGYITLTYRKYVAMAGMSVTLESSDDLQTWTPVPSDQLLSKQLGTDAVTGDPIVEVGAKMDGAKAQFVRLKVTSP